MDLCRNTVREEGLGGEWRAAPSDLAREVNHRIANSLHLVSGYLSLQARDITDQAAKAALKTAASRIAAVGRIQRALLDGDGSSIELAPFLQSLCADIETSTGLTIEVEADDIVATAAQAQCVAIIVNELLLNTAKHAYGEAGGHAKVTCRRSKAGCMVLTVSDGGRGLPDDFDSDSAGGVGMMILRSAAQQLGGELTFASDPGAKVSLRL